MSSKESKDELHLWFKATFKRQFKSFLPIMQYDQRCRFMSLTVFNGLWALLWFILYNTQDHIQRFMLRSCILYVMEFKFLTAKFKNFLSFAINCHNMFLVCLLKVHTFPKRSLKNLIFPFLRV